MPNVKYEFFILSEFLSRYHFLFIIIYIYWPDHITLKLIPQLHSYGPFQPSVSYLIYRLINLAVVKNEKL